MQTKIRPIADKMRHLTTGLTALALATGTAQAANIQWIGLDDDWNASVLNWSPNQFPANVSATQDVAVIDNNSTVTISSNTTANKVGLGMSTQDGFFTGAGLNGKIIQSAGAVQMGPANRGRVALGGNGQVGIYVMNGGTLLSGENTYIGNANSSATAWTGVGNTNPLGDESASGFFQNAGNSTHKSIVIARFANGAKGFYEMNSSGTISITGNPLIIANDTGRNNQKGIFRQTAGTVTINNATTILLGAGAGSGGTAIYDLLGGTLYAPGANLVNFTNAGLGNDIYFNIAGGTLKVDNADNGGNPWTLAALMAKDSGDANDWRSYGVAATAENTFFLPNDSNTDITAYNLLHRNVSGNNDYTTAIALTENKYIYSDSGTLTLTSGSDITGAFNLKLGGTGDIIVSDPVAITGMLAKDGAGTVTLNGATNNVAGLAVDGGVLAGTNPISNTGTYTMMSGSVSIPLAGGGSLIKAGTGTVILSGDNSAATGTMLVSGGALQFNSTASVGGGITSKVTVNSGGTVMFGALSNADIQTAMGRIATASAGTIAADNNNGAAAVFDFSSTGLTAAYFGAVGNVDYTGTLTPNGTAYRLGGGGGTLTMANTNALTGARTLTVDRNARVILASDNDYTGTTTIQGGSLLQLNSATALGTGGLTFSNGTLGLGAGDFIRPLTAAGVAGGVFFTDQGGWAAYGADRVVNINNDSHQIVWATATGGFNGKRLLFGSTTATHKVTFQNPIDVGNTGRNINVTGDTAIDAELSGNISGTTGGGITTNDHNGSGTVLFSGDLTYPGNTQINMADGGTTILTGNNNLPGTFLVNLGTLVVGSANATFGAASEMTLGGPNENRAASILIGGAFTVARPIRTPSIINTDNGTRVLTLGGSTAANSEFSGQITMNSINNASRPLTLTAAAGGQVTFSGLIRGGDGSRSVGEQATATVTKVGLGTVVLSKDTGNTYESGTTINQGTLLVNNTSGTGTGSGAVTVNSPATFGGTGIIAGNVTYATGAKALFTVTPSGGANTTPLTITGVMTYDSTEIHLNLPAGLQNGTYDLATSSATPVLNGTFPTPVVDSGSYQGGSSGEITLDTVNMKLVLTVTGGATSPYETWAGAGVAFDADANGDGVDNGMAWMLGAFTPADNANGLLPDVANDGTFLTLDFERVNPYAPAKLYVQYSNDLVVWTELEIPATSNPDVGGTGVQVEASAATPKETVTVKIPTSYQSASGALFARLRAAE